MTEPDVALTDYLLAAESFLFVWLLLRPDMGKGRLRFWFIVYFVAASIASACGGTVHGFLNDAQSMGQATLWRATLLAVGVATLANWAIGARLLFTDRIAKWIVVTAGVQLFVFCAVVLFLSQNFRVVIADNLPAVLFLITALLLAHRREPHAGLLVAASGMSLTLVAAAIQQLHVGIHPVYFNHNAVFHVVQAVGILLFFLGGRSLTKDGYDRSNSDDAYLSHDIQPSHTVPEGVKQGSSDAHSS